MMNPIGIRDEEQIGSQEPWSGDRMDGDLGPGARRSGSGRHEGSGVEMAGMAERYWKELRPSSAGRFRLDAMPSAHDRDRPTGPRRSDVTPPPAAAPPKLRTTAR